MFSPIHVIHTIWHEIMAGVIFGGFAKDWQILIWQQGVSVWHGSGEEVKVKVHESPVWGTKYKTQIYINKTSKTYIHKMNVRFH